MKFEVGKLYRCPDYFLMVYPTIEKVRAARNGPPGTWRSIDTASWAESVEVAAWKTNFLSREIGCQVHSSEPGEIFMFLKEEHGMFIKEDDANKYINILLEEKSGWIIYTDFLGILEAHV